jgi:hypothetical protein
MRKKNGLRLLSFILILVTGAANLLAREKRGAEIIVRMINGQESRGELIAVKAESLIVKEDESGAALSLKIDEINSVKVVHKPQILKWTLLGAATCGIAFSATKYFIFAKEEAATASDWFSRAATEDLGLAAIIGVAFGAAVGAGIGLSKGKDEVFPLAESPLMRVVYLQKLRYLARMPQAD